MNATEAKQAPVTHRLEAVDDLRKDSTGERSWWASYDEGESFVQVTERPEDGHTVATNFMKVAYPRGFLMLGLTAGKPEDVR